MRHLIDITDLSVDEIESILDLADKMKANPAAYRDTMHGRILATLFFEPSTRTRLSFESAMLSLGGSVLGFSSADTSSATKGESLMDTIHTVSCYCDIIAMRHPKEGAPMWFDMLAIPKDAKHVESANTFINHLLEPQVAANNTNFVSYPNAIPKATPLVEKDISGDPTIYTPPDVTASSRTIASPSPRPRRGTGWNRRASRIRGSGVGMVGRSWPKSASSWAVERPRGGVLIRRPSG